MPDVKNAFRLLAALPCFLFAPIYAQAQVKVNSAALQQLQGLPPAPPQTEQDVGKPPVDAPAPHREHYKRHKPDQHPARPKTSASNVPAPKHQPTPVPPIAAASAPPVAPQPPVAPSTIKIEFAAGSASLPAGTDVLLKPFCTSSGRIQILARAPGTPKTPGNAMELSMHRAFAIRAALISCGVLAQNIIPQSAMSASGFNSDESLIGATTKP